MNAIKNRKDILNLPIFILVKSKLGNYIVSPASHILKLIINYIINIE